MPSKRQKYGLSFQSLFGLTSVAESILLHNVESGSRKM